MGEKVSESFLVSFLIKTKRHSNQSPESYAPFSSPPHTEQEVFTKQNFFRNYEWHHGSLTEKGFRSYSPAHDS